MTEDSITKNVRMDGIRGLAVINVVMCHFFCAFIPTLLHKAYPQGGYPKNKTPSLLFDFLTSPPITVFYNAFLAIMIFFMLSGYVLTMSYFDLKGDTLLLKRRLYARYFRLNIPIAGTVFFAYFFYKLGLYYNVPAAAVAGTSQFLGTALGDNTTLLTTFKEASYQTIIYGNAFIRPLWTLSYELPGSFFLLGYYILRPKKFRFSSILIAALFFALIYSQSILYVCLFVGAFLNKIKIPKKWVWPMFIIGFYFAAYHEQNIFYHFLPGEQKGLSDPKAFYSAIAAFFLLIAVVNNFGKKILESKVLQFFGRISFALYTLHFIFLCSLSSYLYIHLPHTKIFLLLNLLSYFIVSAIVSIPFNKYVVESAVIFSNKIGKFLCKAEQALKANFKSEAMCTDN